MFISLLSSSNVAPDSLIDAMTSIVKKLSMPIGYKPERYSNPSLQWFYKVIQAVALEEELPEVPEDSTLPKFKSINTVGIERNIYMLFTNL